MFNKSANKRIKASRTFFHVYLLSILIGETSRNFIIREGRDRILKIHAINYLNQR